MGGQRRNAVVRAMNQGSCFAGGESFRGGDSEGPARVEREKACVPWPAGNGHLSSPAEALGSAPAAPPECSGSRPPPTRTVEPVTRSSMSRKPGSASWSSRRLFRPTCCSRIPSWDTVNRSLEGMVTPGRNDGYGDGAEARVGVFYGPLIAAVGLRCPGGRRRSPGYCSRLRRSSSSSSCMRARAVSSRARAASTRASAASSSARAVSAWNWAAWARAPAVRIPKVGR